MKSVGLSSVSPSMRRGAVVVQAKGAGIERATNTRPEVEAAIQAGLDKCLTATNLPLPNKRQVNFCTHPLFIHSSCPVSIHDQPTGPSIPPHNLQGKVRDTYDLGDRVVIVTTDRQSAFDRLLASVPFKGQVLNQTSAWWMKNSTHIVPNALISTPDPNVSVMKKCTYVYDGSTKTQNELIRHFVRCNFEAYMYAHRIVCCAPCYMHCILDI